MNRMKEFVFPKLMTVGWSRRIIRECTAAIRSRDKEILFDLSRVEWIAPFGLTVLSAAIYTCLDNGQTCKGRLPAHGKCREYLRRIGFDKLFLKGGKQALNKPTSVELKNIDGLDLSYIQDLLQLAEYNFKLDDDDLHQLRMQLIELMTNAQDHANSKMGCFVCAQYYPTVRTLRLSFVDVGRGIPTVLRTLPKYRRTRLDSTLLFEATQPGVTTRKKRAGGMGLTFIRNYLRRYDGTLSIISENGKVSIQPKKTRIYDEGVRFPGTAIDIVMKTGRVNGNA
jgi:anti-sigma regulatory factor (Ser/Thr protein kinase)